MSRSLPLTACLFLVAHLACAESKSKDGSKQDAGDGGKLAKPVVVGAGFPTCVSSRACRVYLGKLFKQSAESAALKRDCVDRSGMAWSKSGCEIEDAGLCVRNHGTTAEYLTAPDFGLPNEKSCGASPGAKWVATESFAPSEGAAEFSSREEGFAEPTKKACSVPVDGVCLVSAVSESCSGPGKSVAKCPTEGLVGACFQDSMPDSELTLWTYYYAPYTASLAKALCGGAGGVWK